MYPWQNSSKFRVCGIALLLALAGGCASQRTASKAEDAVRQQNWDAAVYYYLEASAQDPENIKFKIGLIRARQKAAQEHFRRGMAFKKMGNLMLSRKELRMSQQLDPTHQLAGQILEDVERDLEILSRPDGELTLEEMKRKAAEAKVQPPILDPRSDELITLSFPKQKPVREIYKALGKAYGFNVLFDPKLKDDKLTIELNEVSAKQALEIILQASGHFYKVLDPHSIIVAEDTPQNRREYEDLVIKTFFLSNAEVKDVDKLLRSLIEARRLATNEQLNSITLRDTADKVAIAERLIRISDKAKAEVLVDVELLEINTGNIKNLGMKLTTGGEVSPVLSLGLPVQEDPIDTLDDLSRIKTGMWSINIPSVILNLVKSTSEATSLAQPQMRITEGEKGSLVIGQKEPIPVTSFNTGNNMGGGIVPMTSYQYQDVGIKIDVEPRVHHNREITLKVTVEVSRVVDRTAQPIIGTRNINTVIRLMDGETNMLVGLYEELASTSDEELPFLSSIPLLGRLFTNRARSVTIRDLALTLTPHILRFPDIREEDLAPVWVGTESRISFFGNSPRVHSGRQPSGPFDRSGRKSDEGGSRSRRTPSRQPTTPATRPTQSPNANAPQPGKELVPSSGLTSSRTPFSGDSEPGELPGAVTETQAGALEAENVREPLLIAVEPSLVALHRGQETGLRLVAQGANGPFRLAIVLSFDPNKAGFYEIDPGPGVTIMDQQQSDEGWLALDLLVGFGQVETQTLATLWLTGEEPGPVPLILTSSGGIDGDGGELPVIVYDGAVYVLDEGQEVSVDDSGPGSEGF